VVTALRLSLTSSGELRQAREQRRKAQVDQSNESTSTNSGLY
jgi:hypothetical protein